MSWRATVYFLRGDISVGAVSIRDGWNDFICAASDEEMLAGGTESDCKYLLVVSLHFCHCFSRSSSIPTARYDSGVGRVLGWNVAYSISILSSPTLARNPSLVACQSTSLKANSVFNTEWEGTTTNIVPQRRRCDL
jgi:hypothetical protein